MNPLAKLARSRKFWLLVLDSAVSIALYFLTGESATFLISVLQPIFLLVINSITVEDKAAIMAGTHPAHTVKVTNSGA